MAQKETYYNTRTWLNKKDSFCTGSCVCYHGLYDYDGKEDDLAFVEIGDCYQKVKLHKREEDTMEDFIHKMKTLNQCISAFIWHLENPDEKYPDNDEPEDMTTGYPQCFYFPTDEQF